MMRFNSLLTATWLVIWRNTASYLLAAVIPFLAVVAFQIADDSVLDLRGKSLAYAHSKVLTQSPLPFVNLFWDLVYFIPLAAFGASVVRIVVDRPTGTALAKLTAFRRSDLIFVATALAAAVVLSPPLYAVRMLGIELINVAIMSSGDQTEQNLTTIWLVMKVTSILGTASVWWVFLALIGFRLTALAHARPGAEVPPLFSLGQPIWMAFGVSYLIWLATESVVHFGLEILPDAAIPIGFILIGNVVSFLQVALIMSCTAIACDVARAKASAQSTV